MLLIRCPWCGDRPELEFTYGGEAHRTRPKDPALLDDAAWAEYLYARGNAEGISAERWRHSHGCARFFNALRDTVSDRFLATYKISEKPPVPRAPGAPAAGGNQNSAAERDPA
ncbi:MAG: sarcosine oxidase subunit delta [Acetobacteraceae bacterium]